MLYVNVSKVEDEVDREEARLYNPFIITITKSPMHLIYPYHFVGVRYGHNLYFFPKILHV